MPPLPSTPPPAGPIMLPSGRPRPVYAVDAPLAELATAELFVVSALRLWALPHRDPGGSHPDWRGGFFAAGIDDEGMTAFDVLLRIAATAAKRPLDVRCLRCPRLGEDEAWLLQLVSLLQRRRRGEAAAILGEWLPPAAQRMALMPAEGFADALGAVGLGIVLRHPEAAGGTAAAGADRGLALLQ